MEKSWAMTPQRCFGSAARRPRTPFDPEDAPSSAGVGIVRDAMTSQMITWTVAMPREGTSTTASSLSTAAARPGRPAGPVQPSG